MVKGCQKKIIQIKETGNALFTEAYFVLSDAADTRRETDIVAEATKLIADETVSNKETVRLGWAATLGFLAGIIVSALCLTVYLWLS
ncbi:MAG: hypothetical protein J6D21_09615 [Clostridia bacterium]|nr:hypothetical protein [Clostridia bacterium]